MWDWILQLLRGLLEFLKKKPKLNVLLTLRVEE